MNKLLLARITTDTAILAGKPAIRGMRISVEQIVKAIAAGISFEELLEDYPELEKEDIKAALTYAAMLVAEQKLMTLKLPDETVV